MSSRGKLFILSAPAGTGKTTLVNRLVKELPHVVQSISYTTREPREMEVNGIHYHFVTPETFQKRIASGDFLEHVTLYGDDYGTSRSTVEKLLNSGKHVFLVIDTQGALMLKGKVPAVFIFVSPPSIDILRERVERRKTEKREKIEARLKLAEQEMQKRKEYDFEIVNDNLDEAFQKLKRIVLSEEKDGKSNE